MKNRFIVIYTVLAAAGFIFSVSFFGFNLYKEYTTNQIKSDERYTSLINDIRKISYNQNITNAALSQEIKKSIGDPLNYSFIQVRCNNETIIFYPNNKVKEETVSKLTKSFTTKLSVNDKSFTVDCNIYLIRPDSIFYFARISFLMILIITIITIIMIIYLNLSETSSDVISLEENEETNEEDFVVSGDENTIELSEEDADAEIVTEETEDTKETSTDNDNTPSPAAETVPEEADYHAEVTPEEVKAILSGPLTDEQAAQETEPSEPAKLPLDEIKPAPINEANENEPSGLFDPETGIGWESYLFTRLNNEIDRATASEIDLALFIIKLPDIPRTSEFFKNVCNYLAIQFQFKDLLFEHKEDCIVAIKISMNVDEALTMADKLYSDISNIIDDKSCRIGISSRSIRMVTGDRLILEAEQAIEHSDETSPVIAFRVDSEKYRQMMEQNQGN